MTTISPSLASNDAAAVPKVSTRNLSLDRTRTFLTLVVVFHHSVIAYTYFGHTDPKYWLGFDMVVLATDSFFMAMFFFLSGLFVWPSLAHKAPQTFVRDRLVRLGLPFVIAAFTIIPIAYYAIEFRQHPDVSFSNFWWKTVTKGPWHSGPLWFVYVLMLFDLTASVLFRISPKLLDPINRLSLRGLERPSDFFVFLVVVTAIVYIPLFLYYGPSYWFQLGPFDLQASRVLLYAAYFYIGAGVGAAYFGRGLLSPEGQLAKSGWGWVIVTLIPYCLLWVMITIKREILGNPPVLPHWYEAIYGLFLVCFSAAILFAILAYFLRFKRSGVSILDPMQPDAYGIFLVHYPIVLWLQYWLFNFDIPAIGKALIAFVLTTAFSWAITRVLRQIPGAKSVL
jgi:peptidoglycan/LPS O-acetylase OafA/YrhL